MAVCSIKLYGDITFWVLGSADPDSNRINAGNELVLPLLAVWDVVMPGKMYDISCSGFDILEDFVYWLVWVKSWVCGYGC